MRPDPINWGFVNSCVLAEMAAVLLCGHWREDGRGGEWGGREGRGGKKGTLSIFNAQQNIVFHYPSTLTAPPFKKKMKGFKDELKLKAKGISSISLIVCFTLQNVVHQCNLDTPLNTGAFFTLMKYIQISFAFVLPSSRSKTSRKTHHSCADAKR